jgi:hypothetical protein
LAGVCNTIVGEGGRSVDSTVVGRAPVRRELPHKNYLRHPTDRVAPVGEN